VLLNNQSINCYDLRDVIFEVHLVIVFVSLCTNFGKNRTEKLFYKTQRLNYKYSFTNIYQFGSVFKNVSKILVTVKCRVYIAIYFIS